MAEERGRGTGGTSETEKQRQKQTERESHLEFPRPPLRGSFYPACSTATPDLISRQSTGTFHPPAGFNPFPTVRTGLIGRGGGGPGNLSAAGCRRGCLGRISGLPIVRRIILGLRLGRHEFPVSVAAIAPR